MSGKGWLFSDDPVLEMERGVIQNARKFTIRVKTYLKENPEGVPPKEVVDTQKEAREALQMIEKMRLEREKLVLAQRIALARLPAIDEAAVDQEVKRLVSDYLHRLDGKTLYALASARLEEERKREEEAQTAGRGVIGAIGDGSDT